MKEFAEHRFVQYVILILAVVAGIVALKSLVSYIPDNVPVAGAAKRVILAV